jgi:hypothetical protein
VRLLQNSTGVENPKTNSKTINFNLQLTQGRHDVLVPLFVFFGDKFRLSMTIKIKRKRLARFQMFLL